MKPAVVDRSIDGDPLSPQPVSVEGDPGRPVEVHEGGDGLQHLGETDRGHTAVLLTSGLCGGPEVKCGSPEVKALPVSPLP